MNTQLFIPDKIKVGYQERSDTYTKRLAYVIYYDKKGVLRKETSWRGWIDQGGFEWQGTYPNQKRVQTRDPLDTHDFENIPTEGFVLNKGAGGHAGSSSSWNIRRETIRVFDPRGFEFEISIANLLFILENSNSYKGKGLEGEFVYSWEGKELVLLPTSCQEYQRSKGFTSLQDQKVSAKTLVLGATYETKRQEKITYIGRYDWFTYDYDRSYRTKQGKITKSYVFRNETGSFITQSGLTSLARVIDDTCISNYSDIVEELQTKHAFNLSKPLEFIEKDIKESIFKEARIN